MNPSRTALVLGSGGATGAAWEIGALAGLADGGVPLEADRVIGTSAGALVAARLTTGSTLEQLLGEVAEPDEPLGKVSPAALARLFAAQVAPSRRHALVWLGRRAQRAWTPTAEAAWVAGLVPDLAGRPWPGPLVIVATEAASGRPAFFSARQPTDLALAVAASCAMPGVFPAVQVDGRLYFDGGLRSPVNLDLAAAADSVIALAPISGSVRRHRRPEVQARLLSGTLALLRPDAASRAAIGLDILDPGRAARVATAARAQGRELAHRLGGRWPG